MFHITECHLMLRFATLLELGEYDLLKHIS